MLVIKIGLSNKQRRVREMSDFIDIVFNRLSGRITWNCINFVSKKCNETYLEHLHKFFDEKVEAYIELVEKFQHKKAKISVNSLKLSYKIYKETGKLFLPTYYRQYYGHWQRSSGACCGLVYCFNENKPTNIYEYMAFQPLANLIQADTYINFEGEIGNMEI